MPAALTVPLAVHCDVCGRPLAIRPFAESADCEPVVRLVVKPHICRPADLRELGIYEEIAGL